jgi:cold-inducible RNA-binding protein
LDFFESLAFQGHTAEIERWVRRSTVGLPPRAPRVMMSRAALIRAPGHPAREKGTMKLYVGNLSYDTTEDEIRELFAAYGTPDSVRLITDRMTGRAKGFGFVEFSDDQAARNAMSALNGKEVGGRRLTVNEARPQENRGGGGDRGGYSPRGSRY